jgi:hypothetical protein
MAGYMSVSGTGRSDDPGRKLGRARDRIVPVGRPSLAVNGSPPGSLRFCGSGREGK